VILSLSSRSMADYRRFLAVKQLPHYRIRGGRAWVPDEYAHLLEGPSDRATGLPAYRPIDGLFDYQRDIAGLSIRKRNFAVFADCGLGKTLMLLEWARYVADVLPAGRCVLIVCPLMVVTQTLAEVAAWYGDRLPVEQVHAGELGQWLASGEGRIGITNFEALTDELEPGRLGALAVDESSMLKSHYGKWGQVLLRLGRGLAGKWAGTGTPAPNDRIEYANHAVLMDAFPTVNAFLARFFVNRGQTAERWELKPHALGPFYRALSHWSIFLTNPATYGWRDNAGTIPPIHAHIHQVPLTAEQQRAIQEVTGNLIATQAGGIGQRGKLGQISKGRLGDRAIATKKPAYIRRLVESWPDESTIIWCGYNDEQDLIARQFPGAANIDGDTPLNERLALIDDFKAGRRRLLITKPRILGFGLNLQRATRQVFSWLQDSYELYYQAVKRSNRVGSTRPLNVHIPITDAERPMVETVLAKADRVQADTEQQERLFREHAIAAA
jgi:hypothetical protein